MKNNNYTDYITAAETINIESLIQSVLTSNNISTVAAGDIEEAIGNLVAGWISPIQLTEELTRLFTGQLNNKISTDLQQQVIVPLQKEMQSMIEQEAKIDEAVANTELAETESEESTLIDTKKETDILNNAGITIEETTTGAGITETPILNLEALQKDGIAVQNSPRPFVDLATQSNENVGKRDTLLTDIENPPASNSVKLTGIVTNKLQTTFSIPQAQTDHSLPKIEAKPPSTDAYRESV